MSKKAAEHHKQSQEHHAHAARHHGEAANTMRADSTKKQPITHTARGHALHARHHSDEAAMAHMEEHGKK